MCRAFEDASGTILEKNFKTVILGLGSLEGCQVLPLPWMRTNQLAKMYGGLPEQFTTNLIASWDLLMVALSIFCMSGLLPLSPLQGPGI